MAETPSHPQFLLPKWLWVALIALITLGGLQWRLWDFNDPFTFFTDDADNWYGFENGALYGAMARNQLNRGLIDTKFAGLMRGGNVSSPFRGSQIELKREYYVRHPPLFILSLTGAYALFGISHQVSRVIPILFSLIALLGVTRIAHRLYGRHGSIVACLLMAALPAGSFYGSLVDVQGSMLMGFNVLALNAYLTALRRPDHPPWKMICLWLSLGCLTDWPGYFLAGLVALHQCVLRFSSPPSQPRSWPLIWGPVAVGLGWFGVHVAQVLWVNQDGAQVQAGLVETLIHHSPIGLFQEYGIKGPAVLAQQLISAGHKLLTPLGAWLGLTLMAASILRRRKQGPSEGFVIAWLFAGIAWLHIGLFAEIAVRHLYWFVYWLPAVALALTALFQYMTGQTGVRRVAAVVLILTLTTWGAIQSQKMRFPSHSYLYHLGQLIGENSQPEEMVITSEMDHIALTYYADRWIYGFVTDDRLTEVPNWDAAVGILGRIGPAIYVLPDQSFIPQFKNEKVRRALKKRFASRSVSSPIGPVEIFDLQSQSPSDSVK